MRAQAEIVGLLIIMVLLVVGFAVYLSFATSVSSITELQPDQKMYLTTFIPVLTDTTICESSTRGVTLKDLAFIVLTESRVNPCARPAEDVFNETMRQIIDASLNQSFQPGTYELSISDERAGYTTTMTYAECDPNPLQVSPRSDILRAGVGSLQGPVKFTIKICIYQ